jgi:hypothetical protein
MGEPFETVVADIADHPHDLVETFGSVADVDTAPKGLLVREM